MTFKSSGQNNEFQLGQLNRYLSEEIRTHIELNYYAKVEQQAKLDYLIRDKGFLADPTQHVGLYSDHGIVHVRDVAHNILQVLQTINGVLIPKIDDYIQFEGMKAFGVMLAYLHDIGMRDFSAFGRTMHPEFAAQEVFSPAFDEIVDVIWDDNCGNIAWGLVFFFEEGLLTQSPKLILREMLSMAVGHSKSKVPISVLNNPAKLRAVMMQTISVNLHHLYHEQQVNRAKDNLKQALALPANKAELDKLDRSLQIAQTEQEQFLHSEQVPDHAYEGAQRYYDDFENEAFRWFLSDREELRLLLREATDVVRALRVADALRQRGTALKTSGGYHISADQNTARAIYTLQKASGETFLMEGRGAISAGEANIASSELSPTGDLWISFQRGSFADQEITRRAAHNAAIIIDDIQRDIIDTFSRPPSDNVNVKPNQNIQIFIENTDDNLTFADLVKKELEQISPELGDKSQIVPSLKNIAPEERERYLEAKPLDWSRQENEQALARIAESGHKITDIDLDKAFRNVRMTTLKEGEVLAMADSPHGFVYVATNGKLISIPRGGYQPFEIEAWSLIGRNSVIRGDVRSDTNSALSDVDLLMIPKETYLKYWHHTYRIDEIVSVLDHFFQQDQTQEFDDMLHILEQVVMIDGELHDTEIEFIQNFATSYGVQYSTEEIKSKLLTGESTDFPALRRSILDYLVAKPPYSHVARFKDLLHLLVETDRKVSEEELLILTELNALLLGYLGDFVALPGDLDGDAAQIQYRVFLVPQNTEQDREIQTLLPDALKVNQEWGHAYVAGIFYSEGYADLIREKYRGLKFYAVVEKGSRQ